MKSVLFTTIIAIIWLASCDSKKSTGLTYPVLDSANILTQEERDSLLHFITELSENTGPQIAIVTVDPLRNERIEDYSLRTARLMKLGRDKFADGILITIAVKNHQVRIEVGRGLEKIVRDEVANAIIIYDMSPKFKTGDFYGGLRIAVMKLTRVIEHDKKLIGF